MEIKCKCNKCLIGKNKNQLTHHLHYRSCVCVEGPHNIYSPEQYNASSFFDSVELGNMNTATRTRQTCLIHGDMLVSWIRKTWINGNCINPFYIDTHILRNCTESTSQTEQNPSLSEQLYNCVKYLTFKQTLSYYTNISKLAYTR